MEEKKRGEEEEEVWKSSSTPAPPVFLAEHCHPVTEGFNEMKKCKYFNDFRKNGQECPSSWDLVECDVYRFCGNFVAEIKAISSSLSSAPLWEAPESTTSPVEYGGDR